MPISSATSPIAIRWLSKIILFTASMFSSAVDVLGRPGGASILTSSRPSLNRLYHNWTYVLLIVDSPKGTVNISHVLAHFISIFTQNWSIFLNSKKSKSTSKYDQAFYLSNTNWQSKMADIVNIYNRHVDQHNRKKMWRSNIRNSRNGK